MDRRKLLLIMAVVVALVGAGLVFVYAKGADSRAAEAYRPVTVFVAAQDIAVGESFDQALANQKITSREIPENVRVGTAVTTVDELRGQSANARIDAGEQILTSNYGGENTATVLAIPDGMIAVAVQLSDTARVAGFVGAGSEVVVWLNAALPGADGSTDGDMSTRVLLDRAQVIAAGSTSTQNTTNEDGTSTVPEQMPRALLTLALSQEDAERVQLASRVGELSFGLLTPESDVKPSKGLDVDSLFR